jgi:hypothetical protein
LLSRLVIGENGEFAFRYAFSDCEKKAIANRLPQGAAGPLISASTLGFVAKYLWFLYADSACVTRFAGHACWGEFTRQEQSEIYSMAVAGIRKTAR